MEQQFNSTKDQVLAQLLFEQAHLEYVNSLIDEQSKAVKRINKLKQSMIDDQFKVSGKIDIDIEIDNVPLEKRLELQGILNQYVFSTPGLTTTTKEENGELDIKINIDDAPLAIRSELLGILNQYALSTPGLTYVTSRKENVTNL